MLGGLKKMTEKKDESGGKPQRAVILTTSIEVLKLTPNVPKMNR